MKRVSLLLLFLIFTVPSCLFHHHHQLHSVLYDPVRDYLGLEEGVVWRYSFGLEGEEAGDTLLMAVVSMEERDGSIFFKIREEWGTAFAEEPLQGYYWSYDEMKDSYHEVGRWNQWEDFFYTDEEQLLIIPRGLSVGDEVFENFTHGDAFAVKGREEVTVVAGDFEAWVLEAQWGDKERGPWEEDRIFFVPHIGVVKRELIRGYSVDGQVQEEFPFILELLDYSQNRS